MNATPSPLISVVIPAYNAADTILRALRSVKRQTVAPLEVLVVDDCSVDVTRALVSEQTEIPVELISLPRRGGAANARNIGIGKAKGDLVALLDADDEWIETKLEKQIKVIESNPSMTFVACRSLHLSADGHVIGPIHGGVPIATGTEAWRSLLVENFVATPSVMARREAVLGVGGFDPALPIAEDQDLWIRLALAGEVGFVDEVLVLVYERPGSLSLEYKDSEADITLPMILRHLDRQRDKMSAAEIRQVLSVRYAQNGRRLYASKKRLRGLRYLWLSSANGYPITKNLWYTITAAPGATWLKRHLLGRR